MITTIWQGTHSRTTYIGVNGPMNDTKVLTNNDGTKSFLLEAGSYETGWTKQRDGNVLHNVFYAGYYADYGGTIGKHIIFECDTREGAMEFHKRLIDWLLIPGNGKISTHQLMRTNTIDTIQDAMDKKGE